jgi:hypothetical protein
MKEVKVMYRSEAILARTISMSALWGELSVKLPQPIAIVHALPSWTRSIN